MDTLAVFKSRSEALNIYAKVKQQGFAAIIISTPPKLNLGCGLCINFNYAYRSQIENIIKNSNVFSFQGFYSK